MKELKYGKTIKSLTCIALLFVGLVVNVYANNPLPGWQACPVDCSVTQNSCVYDDHGNCLGGTKTTTPGTETDCGAATSGTCKVIACVKGAPSTSPCCSN